MGAGALYLAEQGIVDRLRAGSRGPAIEVEEIRPRGRWRRGWQGVIAINSGLRDAVKKAIRERCLPIVFGGGCLVSLGVISGLGGTDDLGAIWFDAHGDLNTPETSLSGCIEGMPLALLLGRFGEEIRRELSILPSLQAERVVLAAARDLDPGEESFIRQSNLLHLSADIFRKPGYENELIGLLANWVERCSGCYLHIDVDCMATEDAPAVMFASPGGLPVNRLGELLRGILPLPPVRAASITAVYPKADRGPKTAESVLTLLEALLERITGAET